MYVDRGDEVHSAASGRCERSSPLDSGLRSTNHGQERFDEQGCQLEAARVQWYMRAHEYAPVFAYDRARPLRSTDLLTPRPGPEMIDDIIRQVIKTEVPTCRVCHQEFKGYATLATHQSTEDHWLGTDGEAGGAETEETDAEDSDLEDVSDVNFSDSECDWSEEVGDSDSDSDDESDEEKLDNAQNDNVIRDVTA
ncbi:hypothetical protein Bbelb_273480 [Branchiostoma belcheri]|nr:hypothetical protein Bbelb_273480 [Branchiostoma belcheri]